MTTPQPPCREPEHAASPERFGCQAIASEHHAYTVEDPYHPGPCMVCGLAGMHPLHFPPPAVPCENCMGRGWFGDRTGHRHQHCDCDARCVVFGCHQPHAVSGSSRPPATGDNTENAGASEEVTDATLTAWAAGTHTLAMVPRLIDAVRDARDRAARVLAGAGVLGDENAHLTSAVERLTIASIRNHRRAGAAEMDPAREREINRGNGESRAWVAIHADRDRYAAALGEANRNRIALNNQHRDLTEALTTTKARADRLHRILDQLVWVKDAPRDATRGKKAGAWDAARDAVKGESLAEHLRDSARHPGSFLHDACPVVNPDCSVCGGHDAPSPLDDLGPDVEAHHDVHVGDARGLRDKGQPAPGPHVPDLREGQDPAGPVGVGGGNGKTWESYRAKVIEYAVGCVEVGNKRTADTLLNTLGAWAPDGFDHHAFRDLLAAREADGSAAAEREWAARIREMRAKIPPRTGPPQVDTVESLRALIDRLSGERETEEDAVPAPPGDVALIATFLARIDGGSPGEPEPEYIGQAVDLVDWLLAHGHEILRRIA